MRPKKQMNPGRDGSTRRPQGKGRYFAAPPLPQPESPVDDVFETSGEDDHQTEAPRLLLPDGSVAPTSAQGRALEGTPASGKYVGRASVGPSATNIGDIVVDLTDPMEWEDPLDDDSVDLLAVTIDLRSGMRDDPPDTYYQRYVSKVPGRTPS